MILRKGKPGTSEPWRMLEVAPNQQPDIIASRLSREIKKLPEQLEVVVPFTPNANGLPEWIVEHVYVRGANGSLPRLVRVPGIECARQEIPDSEWIGRLLEAEKSEESTELQLGQFVRVLSGPCGMMCGDLVGSQSGTVTVQIRLKTKILTCHTSTENIQSLAVPSEQRVFYYQPALFS